MFMYLTWMEPTGAKKKSSTLLKYVVGIIQTCLRQGKLSFTQGTDWDLKMGKDESRRQTSKSHSKYLTR